MSTTDSLSNALQGFLNVLLSSVLEAIRREGSQGPQRELEILTGS